MRQTRVLLVDPRDLVRAGLRALLATDPTIDVVAEATTSAQALALAREHRPEVVLLDPRLPDGDGVDTCRHLRGLGHRPAVAMLTDQSDDASVRACVGAGAQGYVLQDVSADELRRAVHRLARGEGVIDPRVAPLVLSALRQAVRPSGDNASMLRGRRRLILQLVADGSSNREIAAQTNLSELTVKSYVEEILDALGARNRVHAAVLALRRGLIS